MDTDQVLLDSEKSQSSTIDPPTIITSDGTKEWHNKEGQLHREGDLPARISLYGHQAWYINGKLHRENDKPAIIYFDGRTMMWYKKGKLHRDNDLPAIIRTDGELAWYKEGVFYKHIPSTAPRYQKS